MMFIMNSKQKFEKLSKEQAEAADQYLRGMTLRPRKGMTTQQITAEKRVIEEKMDKMKKQDEVVKTDLKMVAAAIDEANNPSQQVIKQFQVLKLKAERIAAQMEKLQTAYDYVESLAEFEKNKNFEAFKSLQKRGKQTYKSLSNSLNNAADAVKAKKTGDARDKIINAQTLIATVLGLPQNQKQLTQSLDLLASAVINPKRAILQTTQKKKNYLQRVIRGLLEEEDLKLTPSTQTVLRSVLNQILTEKMAIQRLAPSKPGNNNAVGLQFVPLQKKMVSALQGAPGFGLDSRGYTFFDKYKYNQVKPTQDQLKQFAAGRASLQSPAGHLQAYPQWLIARSGQIQKAKLFSSQSMKAVLSNENNDAMKQLAAIDPKIANFNYTKEQWQGTAPNLIRNKIKSPQLFAKRYAQSNFLISQKLTAAQVESQVPPIIKDIVSANDTLSKYGFGPVKPDGVGLYAGRWLDTVTGNIRVLPTASSKYLNPLDVNQKLGFIQARILNHWNNLVNSAQQYNTLLQNKDKYAQKVKNQIQASLNPAKVKQLNSKTINRIIDQYLIYKSFGAGQIQGVSNLNKYKAMILNVIPAELLTQIRDQNNQKDKIKLWTESVTQAYDRLQIRVNSAQGTNVNAQVILQSKLSSAYLSLVDTSIRKVKGALKKIMMIKTVPQKITQQNALQTVQALQQGNQFLNDKLNGLTLDPVGVRDFMDKIRSTFLGKSEQQIAASLSVPAQLSTSTIKQIEAWQGDSQLFANTSVNPWIKKIQTNRLLRKKGDLQDRMLQLSQNDKITYEPDLRFLERVSRITRHVPLSQQLEASRRQLVQNVPVVSS